MPVPVPRYSKPPSHPVSKQVPATENQSLSFQSLTRTLPVSPTGPPPSFGTREQWINSLPTWRRTKPRRIWEEDTRSADHHLEQGFQQGLAGAGNASVIKGTHAEASIPPLYNLLTARQQSEQMASHHGPDSADADDEMICDSSPLPYSHFEVQTKWIASSSTGIDDAALTQARESSAGPTNTTAFGKRVFVPSGFTPPLELDHSPGIANGYEGGSSPLQPITPFGVYVDRAVAYEGAAHHFASRAYSHQDKPCGPHCYPNEPIYQTAVTPHEPGPASATEVVTPSASTAYKKLAEPLADWVATYVWKVCTTGLNLPSTFVRSTQPAAVYPNLPPSHLASSVHSLLLSTLLQPSAVFLALWYIVRLPVYLSAAPLGSEYDKESRFRAALLGDHFTSEKEAIEAGTPFRLIVLGCMFANKWLDDHTFSNKTWHNISNVPVQSLNRLESLALDIFAYDLTISSRDWSKWLSHLMSYHMSLASPTHPQPISRPSTNPHSIVRKAIEEITQAPVTRVACVPQPVFLGLEERKREKLEKEAMAAEVLDIDLDEDGPLREEYLPKRRISAASSYRNSKIMQPLNENVPNWERRNSHEYEKALPPPAKWSPSGDEPILRDRNRVSGQYVAVQPPVVHIAPAYPAPYPPPVDLYSHYQWNAVPYAPVKPQSNYAFDFPVSTSHQTAYNGYSYVPQIPISHARSQSLSFEEENFNARQHARSYSQSRFEYQCSDLRMTANEFAPHRQGETAWMAPGHYPYHGSVFAPIHNVNYQPTWLRT
ncbi:hypothetical protein H0H92_004777 [Tricholoma furcatifolium]|nr:hypothetical protein H0H92_004777 [Tricholoma furcatifolium]